jgi:hypothetical protein
MSVIVTANHDGETFDVEVFHDGHIEFPDRDLRHEQAMAEFTDDESAVVQLYRRWKEFPADVIFENFELPKNSHPLLVADYAEHVLPLFETICPEEQRPRLAIMAIRGFAAGNVSFRELSDAANATWAAVRKAELAAVVVAVRADEDELGRVVADVAVWAARGALWDASPSTGQAIQAARAAARSVANSVSSDTESQYWRQAHAAEVAWQVRRFVDAMEAVGQGFDPPGIGATP